MKHQRFWLAMIAVLFCGITSIKAENYVFDDWTSDNSGMDDSESSKTYTFTLTEVSTLSFDWYVSSESGWDKLTVTLNDTPILSGMSGEGSGTLSKVLDEGEYTLMMMYTKDGSASDGEDLARVSNISVQTGENVTEIASGSLGDDITWTLNSMGVLTVTGTGAMPSDASWNSYAGQLTEVVIEEGITEIGDYAFSGCTALVAITIPESVTEIGYRAFEGTAWYDNHPDGVIYIGGMLYGYKGEMPENTSIEVREGIVNIAAGAFDYQPNLIAITLPESLIKIGDYAFEECYNLGAISFPDKLTEIGEGAFFYCSSLPKITIPKGVTEIGDGAFAGCSGLTSIVVAQGNANYDSRNKCNGIVEKSSNTLIAGCINTVIPNNVTTIGYGVFGGLANLTSINIPSSVTTIADDAFAVCSGLTSIIIPENLTSIATYAFVGCTNLTSIVVTPGNEVYDSRNDCNAIIETSSNTLIIGCSATIIPEGVTKIGYNAFWGTKLASIVIPEGVTEIGQDAFYECMELTSVTLPESLSRIDYNAFRGSGITSIILPQNLMSIESGAFADCENLRDVYIYAADFPNCYEYAFGYDEEDFRKITLHVSADILEYCQNNYPWNRFGQIVAISDVLITEISFEESTITLTKGETVKLNVTISPEEADTMLIAWSSSNPGVATIGADGIVTAVSPGTTTITLTAKDGSNVSASCEVKVEDILGKCATPVIRYVDGAIILTSATKGVEFFTNVVDETECGDYEGSAFDFVPTYTFTTYATKPKYETSDIVNVTICWIACPDGHKAGIDDEVMELPSTPILIQSANGVITITGLQKGTKVQVYDTTGQLQGSATATSSKATINTKLTEGAIAIVKVGDYSIKTIIR